MMADIVPPTIVPPITPPIRNAARALIIRDEQVLLLRKDGYESGGVRYALPGGGQEAGESLEQALIRECLEEIACPVTMGELIAVADFYKLRETDPPTRRHVLEFLFRCSVPDSYAPQSGSHPDKHQVAVVWMELKQVPHIQLFPQFLSDCISRQMTSDPPIYLGTHIDNGF